MAELLKREYDIVVLKTELLDRQRHGANVRFTLQYKEKGNLEDANEWLTTTEELGLSDRMDSRSSLGPGLQVQLPQKMLSELQDFMGSASGPRPLWVHLVKPYGVLRFVPWERLLVEALHLPVLMLPDFIFPSPRETRSTLEVVVCGSAPLGHEVASVFHRVQQAVERILEASVRRTRIHVFVDKDFAPDLRNRWETSGQLGSSILLHDHDIAAKYVAEDPPSRPLDRSGSIRSPWLLWMRDALRRRSVDVLHFVCHGYLSRERGALLFAQSPLERTERYLSGPVGPAELETFLTQVGAWSTVFTSLTDNYSEAGIRALADEIAQSRPGPLMAHFLREDFDADALAAAYRFLYEFEPMPPPVSKSLLIYCQPYRTTDAVRTRRVRGGRPTLWLGTEFARNIQQREAAERAYDESPLDALFEQGENVSSMVAATERFAEQVQLRYQQLARDELLPLERGERDRMVAEETISKLRQAVAQVAGEVQTEVVGEESSAETTA